MASKETKLQIVIDAQNKTSAAFTSVKKQLDLTAVSVDGIASAMKSVGKVGTVAFAGLTAFVGSSVKSYGEAQLAIAKVDATLKAMENTTRTVVTGTKEVATGLKLTGTDALAAANKIEQLNLKIRQNSAAQKELDKDLKKHNLTSKEYKLKTDQLKNSTEAARLAILKYGGAMTETDSKTITLTRTITGIGGSFDEIKAKILEASRSVIRLGFDDEAAAVSITKLFQRTGDLNEAIKLNVLAMDLSRSKTVDLETASRMIALVMSGNARALREYGIVLDETKTPMEAIAELQGMVAGQAEGATASILVQTQAMREQFANFKESIGELLIPTLTSFLQTITPIIEKMTVWAQNNPETAKTILMVALALTGVMAVMLPLGIALPGIVLAVQGLAAAVGFLAAIFGVASAPMIAIVALLGIIGITSYKVAAQWEDAWDLITIVVASSANVIQSIVESMINYVITGINDMIKKVNTMISLLASVPGVGKAFKKLSIPEIEKVAFERFDTGAIYNDMMERPQSRSAGEMIINVTGNTFLDQDTAEHIGDLMLSKLKMSNAI